MNFKEKATQYCKESDWKTLTALKFCLFSAGILVGIFLPDQWKIGTVFIFGCIFILTYIPLMSKFYKLWRKQ